MKKIIILGLILLGLNIFPLLVKADIIPDNVHYVQVCSKITNMGDYPDYYLVGFTDVWEPTIDNNHYQKDFFIQDKECLEGQIILIAKKSYVDSIGGVDNIKTKDNITNHDFDIADENVFIYDRAGLDNRHSDIQYKVIDSPIIKESREYYISGISNGKLNLVMSKKTEEYNNGKSPKVETFGVAKSKDDTKDLGNKTEPIKIPAKLSFWQIIKCFFGFSKNC